jgi:hypothetical protein
MATILIDGQLMTLAISDMQWMNTDVSMYGVHQ